MEDMSSFWTHQETSDDLKLKIHYTALELEAVKAQANEEMNKNNESVKQLLHLLKLVCQERDEAKDQIQNLLYKFRLNKSVIHDYFPVDQYPLMKPANTKSIAESNSLSDPYNHSSSPVNPIFDSVTSPEFSNINSNGLLTMHGASKMNHDNLLIERMIGGKTLPQKGKLLKAVMEAGPLLQTLLATNPGPIWGKISSPRFFCNNGQNQTAVMTKQSQQLSEMCYGSFLSFNNMSSSNFESSMMGASFPTASNFGPIEKRQRFR